MKSSSEVSSKHIQHSKYIFRLEFISSSIIDLISIYLFALEWRCLNFPQVLKMYYTHYTSVKLNFVAL